MASASAKPLGSRRPQQLCTKALCEASTNAFSELWPAASSASPSLASERCFDAIVARILITMARPVASSAGLDPSQVDESPLARMSEPLSQLGPLEALAYGRSLTRQMAGATHGTGEPPAFSVDDIAAVYESLLALALPDGSERSLKGKRRKRSGSYYTPRPLAKQVVEAALAEQPLNRAEQILSFKVLDPAVGAGIFLLEACRSLAARLRVHEPELSEPQLLAKVALRCVHGVDINPLSVAVCQLCLWLEVGNPEVPLARFADALRHGDTLIGHLLSGVDSAELDSTELDRTFDKLKDSEIARHRLDWCAAFPETGGFDLVIGNPPWVAYAGRSAEPLPRELRDYYSATYRAWRGFPTLHGLFVERACQLAPHGTVSLLLPSPVADLDGYSSVRQVVTEGHRVEASLPEFGQDAFAGVTQPCFALVARAAASSRSSSEPWPLAERQRASSSAQALEVPEVLMMIARGKPFDAAHFKEFGFQTSRVASETLLLRAEQPDALHQTALLEGRNINEFWTGPPKLFLRAEPALLQQAGCRLRPVEQYREVDFVVRQTASVPIAALHSGLAFRNSLLAGFAGDQFSKQLMVALLNSSLYRALHIACQRDARQAAFPQVKIKHLRALPRPPYRSELWQELEALTTLQSEAGVSQAARQRLDSIVFDLFQVPEDHRTYVLGFLAARAPRYAPNGVFPLQRPQSSLEAVTRALAE